MLQWEYRLAMHNEEVLDEECWIQNYMMNMCDEGGYVNAESLDNQK